MKRIALIAAIVLLSLNAFAQTGGIKATVVNRAGREPIAGAQVELLQAGVHLTDVKSDAKGAFVFENVPDGNYTVFVDAPGFLDAQIYVTVEKGLMRDLMFVSLTQASQMNEVDDSSFAEFDLDDSGYTDTPTILFGANDVYTNVAGYGFSAIRFKNRGYNSESQNVLLAGVRLNDAITGYSPYSLWSGLNEATRSKESSIGMDAADAYVGGYNGVTNITAVPSSVRPGWRFSVLSNSAMYRLRLMANYASGQLDNGWSYAFNASVRMGGNDWIQGVYYRNFAFYGGVEKKFDGVNKLAFIALVSPGERGAQNASTQEVYDLMGDNMYNSNWGYQNGKVRNARVRKTCEPIFALKYDYTPTHDFRVSATLLWRTGFNGYTALDWYDAMDPRPDYYRNLPSYSYLEDEDYNRQNDYKAAWAQEQWNPKYASSYANYQHIDWDRLYNVNYNQASGRSKYAQEQRHVDQNDINLAISLKKRFRDSYTITGGIDGRINRTENYKKIADLLGGQYYLDVDQFAERDFASNEALIQNDLDYFLQHGTAREITKGGKYGYDYLAQVRKAGAWVNNAFSVRNFTANVALTSGVESFWREGLVRKGLFAGLDENGKEISYQGKVLTTYDPKGNVISSFGKSAVSTFFTYSAKAGAQYVLQSGHRFAANVGYFSDAPTFNQAFVSARTRNSIVDDLTNIKTFSADLTYQLSRSGYNARITGFYTKIMDQSDVMSFYDDSQQSFTNFAMTGIDQRHMGIELGVKIPLFIQGLSVSGVLSWGEYIYTSTPFMVQTVDNSSDVVRSEEVPYWQHHPVYKVLDYTEDGTPVYDADANGYIVDHYQKHYVPSSPQLASELALNYRTNSYWFFELNGQYFAHSYLDMNPLYRTNFACSGGDSIATPAEIEYMAAQEEFKPYFLLNMSIGKSWYIQRKYNFGFSLEVKNMLNNTNVVTGGYEQTRLIKSSGKDRYYRFDPKYFYMCGANYMLNLYFRF